MNIKYPQNNEQAAALVAEAARDSSAVIPAGNLSALKREPVVERKDVVIASTRDLTDFSVEPDNLLALAGAGLTGNMVEEKLRGSGLYWPVSGLGSRSLGAIMAEGALGLETMAKGAMPDWILGTTLVDAKGKIVSSGGRTLKNVSGYDFTRLGWRARGRLGLSLAFILKLLPRPETAPVLEIETSAAPEAALLAEEIIRHRLAPEALRLRRQSGRTSLLVWLAGFGELVEHKIGEIESLAGEKKIIRHEDGFAFWQGADQFWGGLEDDLVTLMGSRQALWNLANELGPGLSLNIDRADLDLGGGRAFITPPPQRNLQQFAAGLGLVVDKYGSSGPVYERLRKGLDPQGLFFPDRLFEPAPGSGAAEAAGQR